MKARFPYQPVLGGGRNQNGLREPGVTLKNRDNCSILQLSHLFLLLSCAWPSVVVFVAFQPLSPLCQVPEFCWGSSCIKLSSGWISEDKPRTTNLILADHKPGNHQFTTRHWRGSQYSPKCTLPNIKNTAQ